MPDMMVVEDKIKCSQILRDKELAFKLQSEDSTMIQLNVCESKKSSSEEGWCLVRWTRYSLLRNSYLEEGK